MLLAVISDVHDNLANLDKALAYITDHRIDYLACAGDLTNIDTWLYLREKFTGQIYLVQGNGCNYPQPLQGEKFENLGRAGGCFTLDKQLFGLCHEPSLTEALSRQKPEVIFYGHTHQPWDSYSANGCRLINPGNLANSRCQPTFAVYDTAIKQPQLIIVNQL